MPTFLRLIIILGEIFGFISVLIIPGNKLDKKDRACGRYSEKKINEAKKSDIKFAIVNIIIIVLIFFFSFPQLIFLSYHKMIYFSFLIVFNILFYLGMYIRIDRGEDLWFSTKKRIGSHIALVSLITMMVCVAMILFFYVSRDEIVKFKVLTDQKERVEIIYPEFIDENKKIGHIIDTNRYVFFHKDSKGKWTFMEISPESLKRSDETYVEKCTVTKTFNDIERDKNSDEYVIIENEVTYVLHLNKEQLIELDKAE